MIVVCTHHEERLCLQLLLNCDVASYLVLLVQSSHNCFCLLDSTYYTSISFDVHIVFKSFVLLFVPLTVIMVSSTLTFRVTLFLQMFLLVVPAREVFKAGMIVLVAEYLTLIHTSITPSPFVSFT